MLNVLPEALTTTAKTGLSIGIPPEIADVVSAEWLAIAGMVVVVMPIIAWYFSLEKAPDQAPPEPGKNIRTRVMKWLTWILVGSLVIATIVYILKALFSGLQ